MRFLDIFNPIRKGSHGLTDEAIYGSIQNGDELVPLYGGNSQHKYTDRFVSIKTKTIDGKYAEMFSGEGIIISLDGSAGNMTYKSGEQFVLNHHAGFITLNDYGIGKVNLPYFSFFMQNHYKALAVSNGSKTLSLSQIYSDEFSLPTKATQDIVIKTMNGLFQKMERLDAIYKKINCLLDKELTNVYHAYQAENVNVSTIIGHENGNIGLTEEFIYSTLLLPGERYKVRSSSTSEETLIGYVPRCMLNDSPIKINTRSETLIIARNGNAGQTEYLVNEKYAINDHAYILYVKEDCPYKINLKWFSIQYRSEIMSYTSSSANGTWNMTGFFNEVIIDIPNYDEQLKIVRLYEKAEDMRNSIGQLSDRLSTLLKKEIC